MARKKTVKKVPKKVTPKPIIKVIHHHEEAPAPIAKEVLNTAQAAQFLSVSRSRLELWRHERKGPPYIKMGHIVRYQKSALVEWMDRYRVKDLDPVPPRKYETTGRFKRKPKEEGSHDEHPTPET